MHRQAHTMTTFFLLLLLGIFFVLPCIESYQKVDLRTITLGVPPQEVCMTYWLQTPGDQLIYQRFEDLEGYWSEKQFEWNSSHSWKPNTLLIYSYTGFPFMASNNTASLGSFISFLLANLKGKMRNPPMPSSFKFCLGHLMPNIGWGRQSRKMASG